MVAQTEPLDKQIAGVKIMVERKAARAAEGQKRMTELQEEADTLLYDAESLKQTLEQLAQEKETEKDAGMGEAPSPPIGARPTMVGSASMPFCSASASVAPMQPVLSTVQSIRQHQRAQDDMIKQMLDYMAYNSSMLAALQKQYQHPPQSVGFTMGTETPPLTANQMAMISPAQEMTLDIEHIPGPTGTRPGAPSLQAVEAMAAAYVELAKSHPELIPSSPTEAITRPTAMHPQSVPQAMGPQGSAAAAAAEKRTASDRGMEAQGPSPPRKELKGDLYEIGLDA
ncbi:unnamed protein product [Prorocentrum cordatum]|uniref:Uncharacterized protein n=1 Tax=Prorocentrum cordatum TaxID=2364126 RepID=A0ABN9UP22_9DINO|nr:unnamed protein product [Polarella glacialis]